MKAKTEEEIHLSSFLPSNVISEIGDNSYSKKNNLETKCNASIIILFLN